MRKSPNHSNGSFHPVSAPDFLPRNQLQNLQLQRLKAILQRAYDHVALFHKRMEERDLTPEDVQSLEDITKLPFAVKTDLRDTYPFGLFASPMEDIVRLHASTGTTGKPIVVAYTRDDIQVWANVMMRSFAACCGSAAVNTKEDSARLSSRASVCISSSESPAASGKTAS